jgi:hypothetical protein
MWAFLADPRLSKGEKVALDREFVSCWGRYFPMGKIFSIRKKGYVFGDKPCATPVRGMEVAGLPVQG